MILSLVSACGSPGVTTTVVGLALAWPRPVIVIEADPVASTAIQAGYLRAQVPPGAGLIDLLVAARAGTDLGQGLRQALIPLAEDSQASLLPGIRVPRQAGAVMPLWRDLAPVLTGLGQAGIDVLVDAGRMAAAGTPEPLLRASSSVLLATRTSLPAIAGATAWARDLAETGLPLSLLVIGSGHPYKAGEVSKHLALPVAARLPLDPVSAQVYATGEPPGRRFATSALPKALAATASVLAGRAAPDLPEEELS